MKKYLLITASVLMVASCQVERQYEIADNQQLSPERLKTFYASIEGNTSDTKVYADENLKVLWNAGDYITIFNKYTYNSKFQFNGEDGDNAGGFDEIPYAGYVSGNALSNAYAVYPYMAGTKINNAGTTITLTLPEEQSYKEHSFGIGANAMVAVTNNNFLAFKNVGGYLSLRLYGDNVSVKKVTIQGNNHEKIAGKASIAVGLGSLPQVTMDETATESVSIVCDTPVLLGNSSDNYTDFWFVLPPTTFTNGFTITVTDERGGTFTKSTSNSITIPRNSLERMPAIQVVPDYGSPVEFADANFKAYCVQNFDTDGDGEISVEEALLVTSIRLSAYNIESLKGVEFFQNLDSLTCTGSLRTQGKLNSLDISTNTALTFLNCGYNQLTTLDVSKNTALTDLDCRSNQLTTLDVNNNPALETLNCSSNQLTSLNVRNNTALKRLGCSHNQLESLDVSNNPALETLNCSSNQLTSLNVRNNTALKRLGCSDNQLESLDVSNNPALEELEFPVNQLTTLDVSNNTALEFLDCQENQLTTLDVSNNTALITLWCGSNQLTTLDVSNNTALVHLDCQRNQLTTLDASYNTALWNLGCDNNHLTSLDVSNNTALERLYCDNNQLTSLDVSNNTALAWLYCDNNQLTSLDVSNNMALIRLSCSTNPYLTELWLKTGQTISELTYDTNVTTIYYK